MFRLNRHLHARTALWFAAVALLFAALSPTLNAWRSQGQPRLYAELCTKFGFVKVPIGGEQRPANESRHAPECSLCLPAETWLGMAAAAIPALPAGIGAPIVPPARMQLPTARLAYTLAWARAPPALS